MGLAKEVLETIFGYCSRGDTGIVINRQQNMLSGLDLTEMADPEHLGANAIRHLPRHHPARRQGTGVNRATRQASR